MRTSYGGKIGDLLFISSWILKRTGRARACFQSLTVLIEKDSLRYVPRH